MGPYRVFISFPDRVTNMHRLRIESARRKLSSDMTVNGSILKFSTNTRPVLPPPQNGSRCSENRYSFY